MTMTQICCGIPVYNNAATIADVARQCRGQIAGVVVVDDGSTDADLRDLLKTLNVTVVRHPSNQGKGAALLTALQFAAERGAEYLLTIDGDGQHFPEDIPRFLSRLSPDAILLGSRETIVGDMPRSSLFGREFSDFWICVESGASLRDTQSGFRVYPVKHVLNLRLVCRRYNFEMEILTRAIWAGLSVLSVPVRVWYPNRSERVSSFRPFMDNLRHLTAPRPAGSAPPAAHSASQTSRCVLASEPNAGTMAQASVDGKFESAGSGRGGGTERVAVHSALAVGPDRGRVSGIALASEQDGGAGEHGGLSAAGISRILHRGWTKRAAAGCQPISGLVRGIAHRGIPGCAALALLVYNVAHRFRAEPSSLAGNQT